MTRKNRIFSITTVSALCMTSAAFAGDSITITPANSIQATINSGLYTEIVLSPGTYFQVFDVTGGPLTIRSSDPSDPAVVAATKIRGEFFGRSIIMCTGGVGADVVFDGLTLEKGEAYGSPFPLDSGGAMMLDGASPTVRNCVFDDNDADYIGGGMYVRNGSPTFTNCTFKNNTGRFGGGAYGHLSNIDFTSCVFENNAVEVEGGGMRMWGGSQTVVDCRFVGNSCENSGGAIGRQSSGSMLVERTVFEDNTCTPADTGVGRGGGMFFGTDAVIVNNCVFSGNSVNIAGAAMYVSGDANVLNCTFYDNDSLSSAAITIDSGGTNAKFTNCIIWNEDVAEINGSGSGSVAFTHCAIRGGRAGSGNIGADSADEPAFVDALNKDFRLMAGSAGIDAGDTSALDSGYPVDFNGDPRALNDPDTVDSGLALVGIAVDMGAFEFQPEGAQPPDDCPEDLTGSDGSPDDVIDTFDLLQLLAAWGTCPTP